VSTYFDQWMDMYHISSKLLSDSNDKLEERLKVFSYKTKLSPVKYESAGKIHLA
jgi:hypothetical protein